MKRAPRIHAAAVLLVTGCLAACAAGPEISYRRDVRPILAAKCIDCHTPPYGEGYVRTKLDMRTHASLLEGSIYGPVIVPGDSRKSPLNMLVEGRAGDLARLLERRHAAITAGDSETLRLWVEQGARDN